MHRVIVENLGRVDFKTAWDYQFERQREVINLKLYYRAHLDETPRELHYFLWCEHTPVYTLGKTGSMANLLLSEADLAERGIDFYPINRGGDITFHGIGQVVGYPIFDLEFFTPDIGKYVRLVEEAAIRTCADYGIVAVRSAGESGAWICDETGEPTRKICAVGIHLSRWTTMHGFAFNVATDLAYFDDIIPCGIQGKKATSLERELGRPVVMTEVQERLLQHYAALFDIEFVAAV
jgi:lipoyl(octanoyl) transferase